jgi:hypothetical protein
MAGRPPLREGFGVGDVAGERPPQPDQPASRSTITDLEFTHKFVAHPVAIVGNPLDKPKPGAKYSSHDDFIRW